MSASESSGYTDMPPLVSGSSDSDSGHPPLVDSDDLAFEPSRGLSSCSTTGSGSAHSDDASDSGSSFHTCVDSADSEVDASFHSCLDDSDDSCLDDIDVGLPGPQHVNPSAQTLAWIYMAPPCRSYMFLRQGRCSISDGDA